MHPKFAARIAKVSVQKKKAHGVEALSLWWNFRFGHLSLEDFEQVMAKVRKLRI